MTIQQPTVRLGDVLSPELFAKYDEHIRNFLIFGNISFDTNNLSATEMTERQVKELLEEIAEGY